MHHLWYRLHQYYPKRLGTLACDNLPCTNACAVTCLTIPARWNKFFQADFDRATS